MFESEHLPLLPADVQVKTVASQLPSFADLASAASTDGDLVTVGDEYIRLDRHQKRQLVDVPFIIEDFAIQNGQNGAYSIVRVVTNRNERFSFTDGGTGITAALEMVKEGQRVLCRQGLRASDYEFEGRPAITYYLT